MTKHAAFRRAVDRATQTQQARYVVWSVEDTDAPGQHYHVATEDDTEWFYDGCHIIAAVSPEGEIEA